MLLNLVRVWVQEQAVHLFSNYANKMDSSGVSPADSFEEGLEGQRSREMGVSGVCVWVGGCGWVAGGFLWRGRVTCLLNIPSSLITLLATHQQLHRKGALFTITGTSRASPFLTLYSLALTPMVFSLIILL